MKNSIRLIMLFVVVAVLAIVFQLSRQASRPESAIIADERARMTAAFDKARAGRDLVYAVEFQEKTAFLDYRMAIALIREKNPDRAIMVLQKLVSDEEASGKDGSRHSRSFEREAGYYEVLAQAYELKHDAAAVQKAEETRSGLLSRAHVAQQKERQEEGKWVGKSGD